MSAMSRGSGTPQKIYWKTQLPVDYKDTSLTINTFENVVADLSGGKPARLKYFVIEQTNNGATAETVVLEITINGTAYTVSIAAAASGTPYYIHLLADLATGDFTFGSSPNPNTCGTPYSQYDAVFFCAETVGLIRVKQTTDVDGTSAQIEVNITWDKLVGV